MVFFITQFKDNVLVCDREAILKLRYDKNDKEFTKCVIISL